MNEERYIVFDQYLQDELSAEEKVKFEKELSEDPELASAFETFKELNLHLENKFGNADEFDSFKENLKSISNAHFKASKPKVINFKPWIYLIAASVTVLIGLFLFNPNPNFEDFNQYENAYFTERGDVDKNLKQAEETFNAKKYKAAIPFFEAVLKEKKTPEIQYFYGISLLEANKIKDAEVVFNELKSGTSIYKNKAIWSLALSKLKQKDYKSCKEILLTIPSDYEDYDQVQELLKELD
ncbi:tetratricopeptide repeat protein [Flavobacterium gawalongense]|uniref:Tetratricopeptide repeat protein n=1 Tax=Flavobacterium gawalongense TaxID=2594432 RepID=A0A553BDA9_9FLAO|nr:tetratricopeptide repeat protein [Flavobacterium gawalongense]TRX01333.1 tetratricopeptide repeat protein [Flavobacterium gawalongense]TRX05857.1 tetratricopeptide repeat protein [Flavobacterium gawalongense]TRX06243.1 tetratricopeptide repeat protein [Flavobacterium gawalongense]TRX06987.1 tetratricopeptide repeat protein [Flavobacterium gawalongense]TRX23124.1 tetratricopeptide repeat protein [Flavobacterium gawalongense]